MSKTVKIVVTGGIAVGKSNTISQFCQHQFHEFLDPTIEDNYFKQIEVEGEKITLDILDTVYDDYPANRANYMKNCDGFIVVYSVTSRSTFTELEDYIQQIYQVNNVSSFPIVLVGNKIDLEEREVSLEEGMEFAKRYEQIDFFEASAKERINIDEIFHTLAKSCLASGFCSVSIEKKNKENCFLM